VQLNLDSHRSIYHSTAYHSTMEGDYQKKVKINEKREQERNIKIVCLPGRLRQYTIEKITQITDGKQTIGTGGIKREKNAIASEFNWCNEKGVLAPFPLKSHAKVDSLLV